MEKRDAGTESNGPANQRNASLVAAGLMRQRPEQMHGLDVVRIDKENLPIEAFGLSQIATLMVPQGKVK